ncbi:MAG: tRNA uridine-5-carboxymethylaminomethyl(34) synthesis GTPase MnmE [Prevotellaceae bacterium]|nr:tRNA uridine-5-carboxymethylaminomethyl(34) synthesis GTPase MnmE [Prevotellaceae bacterium]
MSEISTIAAISTAPGKGAIATIRVSGAASISLVDALFHSPNGKKLVDQKPGTTHYGEIRKDSEVVDEVVVSIFRAPYSFTGEDTVEISCHGSIYIQQLILQLLIEQGARPAAPGEFSQRAFLNGKMDLSQAEGVADLIASSSAAAHRLAINQMRGGFSRELRLLRDRLLDFASLIELELDFGEEDVEFADRTQLKATATQIAAIIRKLADSFSAGNVIKNGIPVAIIGETNTGKSTLLNLLLKEDKAIVSDIHGTTRDVIEDAITIQGQLFRFIDTAGIRDTRDKIETLGIERSYRKLLQASIVLWVIDLTRDNVNLEVLASDILDKSEDKQLLLVLNKVDLLTEEEKAQQLEYYNHLRKDMLLISAKKGENIVKLEQWLINAANLPSVDNNDVIITNLRHYEALTHALAALERAIAGIDKGISNDFLAQDARECINYLGEITGQITTDDILGNIFANFCVGK